MSNFKHFSADVTGENRQKTARKLPLPVTQRGTIPIKRLSDPRAHRAPWELTLHIDGKRKRKHYATEDDARKAWAEHKRLVKSFGTLPYRFNPAAQTEYDHALRKLPHGAKLADAVDFFVMHAPKSEGVTLRDAIDRFLQVKTVTLQRSELHAKDLRLRLNFLAKKLGETRRLESVTRNELLDLLLGLGKAPRTVRNFERAWHNLFRYYQRRGSIASNPIDGIDPDDLPAVRPTVKEILTVPQMRGFLRTIATQYPHLIRWAAVQAFAGVRDAEAERMHADYCNGVRIRVPADVCKTGDDWVMQDLPAVLWSWFANGECAGAFPYPSNRLWEEIRGKLAQLPEPAEKISRWPFNALRRSFCTYSISLHGNANQVAAWLRHQNPNRLYNSYLGALVPKETAAAYFALTPDAVMIGRAGEALN